MSTSQQQRQKQPHLLLNLTMIALETFYSFIFKNDELIQRQAKNFIDRNLVLKVNCYIPYTDFYVHFTHKGILFNTAKPEKAASIEISSTILGYFQTLVLGNKKSIRSIKVYGDTQDKDKIRDLLLQLSIPKIASDWKTWLPLSHFKTDITSSKARVSDLLNKIDIQRTKIDNLQVSIKQQKYQILQLKAKQKRLNILFISIIIGLSALLIYNWF